MQPNTDMRAEPILHIDPNDVRERLLQRKNEILEWLQRECPECSDEQKHLDEGTTERAYWHYGYAVALKDVLALLGSASTPKH
jgi:hypothetical protein